ncbi:hypothetical protein L0P44_11335, partial [Streptococcus gordonii]|nr:hypothetical protein [Streptococcus gordonii]
DVQFRERDQKVSALSFHVTLAQMRLARFWRLTSNEPLSWAAKKAPSQIDYPGCPVWRPQQNYPA